MTGAQTSIRVPLPCSEVISKLPAMSLTLCRMLHSPNPSKVALFMPSNPLPSSVTHR